MAVISSFLAMALSQATSESLTLEQAVQIAVDNAYSVQLSESDFERAGQRYREADGLLGPQVNLVGSYTRTDGSGTASFGSPTNGGGTVSGLNEFKQFQVTATKILDITGSARNGVVAAKLQRDAAQEALNSELNSIKNQVRSQYFRVLQADALVRVQSAELVAAKQRLKNAEVRHAAGDLAKYDVLRLETESKRSEQALVVAEGDLETTKQGLNSLLGRAIDIEFSVVDLVDLPVSDLSFQEAMKLAEAHRPEIRSREYSLESFERLRKLQQGGSLPTFTIGAQWTRVIDPFPGQKASSAQAFLQFSIPLYNSGTSQAKVGAARQDEELARISLEQTKQLVSLDVKGAITQLETSRKAYAVAQQGLELAREALRLAQLRYDEGAGILLDVTTSQSELTRAEGSVVTAKYQYLTAVAALQRACGTDDLTPRSGEDTSK